MGSLFTAKNAKSIQPCQSSHYSLTIIYVLEIEDASTNHRTMKKSAITADDAPAIIGRVLLR